MTEQEVAVAEAEDQAADAAARVAWAELRAAERVVEAAKAKWVAARAVAERTLEAAKAARVARAEAEWAVKEAPIVLGV